MYKPKVFLFLTCLLFLHICGLTYYHYQFQDIGNNQISDNTLNSSAKMTQLSEDKHGIISNQYFNYLSHLNSGIQMGDNQIGGIIKVLPTKGNLLVWGLGNDSPFWHNSTKGKVKFIEDDSPEKKAGIHWYSKIMQKFPYLEAYRVKYKTNTFKSFSKYVNNPETWNELDLCSQLPESFTQTHWHVIIVDAPLGCGKSGPGRYQSIYTSWKLAKINTHIFVDDFDRKVEHEFSVNIFGKPIDVIKRSKTKFSRANEQAHFIIHSSNAFLQNTTLAYHENEV
jgi:hypothetical protein